ncbi:cystathionine beta-lyase [Schizosaccharomyces cryophilus OY26]|uniref:cysteine-S-conjugate beta-lyase n=1 Tax=Schizosaccharomyces cryophilus (strain OY26 / ATCC MYA-4695 / CBS 11777 / NBRC 106824 / NRRL Y48691) TaxID=653667 RepID=S9XBU0_SCHCR|nr:cystathionine beta-lyase [Schizosaccharomyces cryophilus OY26]EPY51296.1 cystathionine beta-lyase [Schizosaccharomyces cryophilus OY26]
MTIMVDFNSKYSVETELVRVEGNQDQYNASSVPIYQSATFRQNRLDEMGKFDYTRSGNPTRTALQVHLAKLMKAKHCFVTSNGMSALDMILKTCKAGSHIVAGDDLYGGSDRLLNLNIATYGFHVSNVDTCDLAAFEAVLRPDTALVLIESPTNPLIKICDVRAIVKIVREKAKNAVLVMDNTMLSPILCNPLDFGFDIVYESATKFLSGHHDMMGGAIAMRSDELAKAVFFNINACGAGLAPFESFLLLRGIKTMGIRVERAQQNAIELAKFLKSKGFSVNFPGLDPNCKSTVIFNSFARGPGAVMSIHTGSVELSKTLVESTELFEISVSFGSVESLISMPAYMSHASIKKEVRDQRGLPEDLIRISVGIEDIEDLKADFENAITIAKFKKL